ncbi:MAG: flagellar biosynthetic protein FliR [Bacteriovoracaceae bacterium]|jgi:flagellar biosynthetic protein FliR|nr:flagellar biosynthetic protein FliR [Bacteriovoracaceae bacterium]
MISISVVDYPILIAFWLSFTRWVTILFQLPIFDNTSVPSVVKILSSLLITYAFFPIVERTLVNEVLAVGIDHFWYLTFFNAIVGLFIGFLVKTIMSLFIAAGSLMTQQIGFSSVSYFDPTFVSRIGPFEKIIQWTILIMILSTGALIPMFKGVLNSFFSISMMDLGKFTSIHIFYHEFFKGVFQAAFLLSTPILFTNLVLNMVMGIVARTIPQMNILMVSFVVNIGIGLIVFYAVSEEFFHVAYKMYVDRLGDWFQFVI